MANFFMSVFYIGVMKIFEKFNILFDFPKCIKNFFCQEEPGYLFRKTERLKINLNVNSVLEIKPFDLNLKYIVAKLGDNYLLSKMDYDKSKNKFSFKQLGRMKGSKTLVYPDEDYYPNMDVYESFYVAKLEANELRKGTGRKLIHLAKCESRRLNCEGRVHLDAVNQDNPPFYFYRRMGFDSQDKHKIEIIDKLLEKNKPFPEQYKKWCIPMYFPTSKTGTRI